MKNFFAILLSLLTMGSSGTVDVDITVPDLTPPEVTEIQEGTEILGDNFTDRLYNLMPKDKNYMYSPFSVKSALAMAANGADGATKSEILEVVEIEDLDKFNSDMKATIEKYTATDLLRFDISNFIWLNTDKARYDFSEDFTDIISGYYAGEVGKVTDKDAVPTINKWVNDKTNGKIPSVINSPDFDAALINALYFRGKWKDEFNEEDTKPDIFTDRNGNKTEIDFMNATRKYPYAEKDGVRIIALDYMTRGTTGDPFDYSAEKNVSLSNTSVSMYILLSDDEINEPERIVSEITAENIMQSKKVNLSLPKFKIEYSAEMSPVLKTLGIKSAFGDADFTKMFVGDANTAISNVIHKTYIDVNEEGTEAAAVTAIIMMGTAMPRPEEIIEFKADKPFTFLIRDNISSETLFIGEYAFAE